MPIYAYRCQACQEETEALQKSSDAPLTTCKSCGAEALVKIISPVGVIFRGSGFHKNDYTGSGSKSGSGSSKPAESSAPASESAPSGDAPKTESKSESSGDSKPSGSGDNKVA